jgi:hypothetical protein
LETYGRTIDLKCDTNLLILLASCIYLDACHCDLKFAHPVARISREANVDLKRRDPTSAVRLTSNHAFPERAPNILPRGSRFIQLELATAARCTAQLSRKLKSIYQCHSDTQVKRVGPLRAFG